MSLEYIRNHYGVPAKRGALIRFTDTNGHKWTGRITSARGPYLKVDLPGFERRRATLHPTWNIEYLDG